MNSTMQIIEEFKKPCPCGKVHYTSIQDVQVGSGLVHKVGEILRKNNFENTILLVADKDTLKAADGIVESLTKENFTIEYKIYDEIRVATLDHVRELVGMIEGRKISVLSVGTGSVNDPCRKACADANIKLCIFGTAPSMDGFASYSSPLVDNGFKSSYDAKSPEVIIGDTKILANAPSYLKSAGFGDMVSKYTALVDWQISHLLIDEYYCPRIAKLTRDAIDKLMVLCDKVTVNDEETAGKIFEALLMTGIGMSYSQNSRPASGAEHVVAHLMECVELRDGKIPNYHGEDIGVVTLELIKFYNALASHTQIKAHKDNPNWNDIYAYYGEMAPQVEPFNTPTTITDEVDPAKLEKCWPQICDIIRSVPSLEECEQAMRKAGCKISVADIEKPQKLFDDCMRYSPYMRRRLTLLRLRDMIETID